jgi:putative inorganic carbon (HCO3(-)) transporter
LSPVGYAGSGWLHPAIQLGRPSRFVVSMMSERKRAVPSWLPYLDLICVTTAGALWYAWPHWGPLVIALAPWVIRFALTGRPTRRTPFDLCMALFLLTAVVGIGVAFDRQAAWARFWIIVGAVLLFYALANAESAGSLRVWFLALLGAALAAHFVITHDWQAYATKIAFLNRLGQALQAPLPRLPGLGANPNVTAATIGPLVPFAGLAAVLAKRALVSAPRPRSTRLWLAFGLGLAALVLVSFGLLMTVSRSAWLAVLGALLLAAAWLTAGWLSKGNAARRGGIFISWLILGLVAMVVLVKAWPGAVAALLKALPGPSGIGARGELVRNGLTLLRDYPLTGVGLDGFMMAYSTYVMQLHVGYAAHAHNLFLDLAVEQGVPALLTFLGMCAMFFQAFWRHQTLPDAQQRSSEMAAAALSLVVILLHGLADDPMYKSRAVLFLFVPLAFAGSLRQAQDAGRQRTRRWASLILPIGIITLLAVAVVWRGPLLSRVASNLGAVHQSQAELRQYSWPEWPIQDELRRHIDLGQVVAEFERALELDPGNATANRRLGMIALSLGQYEPALGYLEAAFAAEPWCQTTQQLLGEAYLANGRLEEGRALWSGVSNEQSQLDIRVWWYGHIGEEERAKWMRQAAAGPQ